MFLSGPFVARDNGMASPPACRPFTIHDNVCVGDMIAIIACSIAGLGFFFWAIHAVRKMREFPFTYKADEDTEANGENDADDTHHHVPSAYDDSGFIQHGIAHPPSPPERVHARTVVTQPEEFYHRLPAPIPSDDHSGQGLMAVPRTPPRAGGQSQKSSSRSPSRHTSLARSGTHREGYEYGIYDEYLRHLSPPRARGALVYRQGGDYESRPTSMRRTNGYPMMYGN